MRFFRVILALSAVFLITSCSTPPHPQPEEPPKPFSLGPESPYRQLDDLPDGTIVHVATGREMSEPELIEYLGGSRIVYVGEVHTNIHHHEVELEILKSLEERYPGKVAVGMEMFKYPSQPYLDQWSSGDLDEKTFARVFYENWNEDFDYYEKILRYVRDRHIPLIGLNASDEELRLLAEKGLKGLTPEERKNLPREMDDSDPYHRKAMKSVFGGHSHGDRGFAPFYQTMLLWDETMAQRIVSFLKSPEGKDKRMVVFSGGFHVSYGYGIPRRAFRQFPDPYTIVLPYSYKVPEGKEYVVMEKVHPPDLPLPIADIVWATPYDDLENSRVKLGVQIASSDKGVLIQSVLGASSAEDAGLLAGDIITDFDQNPVVEPFDLVYGVRRKQPGDHARVKVLRDEQMLEFDVTF